jgi:hypothetical protein
MSEPTKKLLELALQGKLRHHGHKILSWNMNCLRVESDGNDNVRPVKPDCFQGSETYRWRDRPDLGPVQSHVLPGIDTRNARDPDPMSTRDSIGQVTSAH